MFGVLVEASDAVQCRRPLFVKRPMAGPALGALAQPFARHAVDRVAMRADNMQRAGHGCSGKARCRKLMRSIKRRLDRHQLFEDPPDDQSNGAAGRRVRNLQKLTAVMAGSGPATAMST